MCRTCEMGNLLAHHNTVPTSRSGMDTINSRFSIRKDRNNGVDFQYDAVVRNRQERKHMLGSDCECCREVSGDGPSEDPQQTESSLASIMKLLDHYRLRDSHSGGRQQNVNRLTAMHQKTTRRIRMNKRSINN